MNRTVLVTVATVALLVLLTPSARGQICIDFDQFCDGLELTVTGNSITGTWINAEGCDGGDVPIVGVIHPGIEGPCPPFVSSRVGIACEERFGCTLHGDEWYWVLNEVEGNLDLGNSAGGGLNPPGACWLDNIEYHVTLGPCSFFGPGNGQSLLSTVQAGR